MGVELPQDGELPGRTTGYSVLQQTSGRFYLQAPQCGQCEKMASSLITGSNAARLSCSSNCGIRVQRRAALYFNPRPNTMREWGRADSFRGGGPNGPRRFGLPPPAKNNSPETG